MTWGERVSALLRPGDVVTLVGTLGAGKTTFARGVLRGLGYKDEVPSPTFAIVQSYEPPECRLPVGHVDLYRLESSKESAELGLEDMLFDGALIVEWPDFLPRKIKQNALEIEIEISSDNNRKLTVHLADSWKERWSRI